MEEAHDEFDAMTALPDLRPNPDPTRLTVQHVQREMHMLEKVISQRLDGYDKAIELIQKAVDREPKPPVLAADIGHIRELLLSKFENIDTRLGDRDKRNESTVRDSKALVDNTISSMRDAFAEQNRMSQQAILKSESAVQKQMEQMNSQFQTEVKSLGNTIADVKDRITTIESRGMGKSEQKEDFRGLWVVLAGAVTTIVSIITVVYTLNKTPPPPAIQFVPVPSAERISPPANGNG